MRIIYKAPGGKPEIRDIPNTLEELQASVGGYIESCTFATDATVICNEEGTCFWYGRRRFVSRYEIVRRK